MSLKAFTDYAEGLYKGLTKADKARSTPTRMFAKFGATLMLIPGYLVFIEGTAIDSPVTFLFLFASVGWLSWRAFTNYNIYSPLKKAFCARRTARLLNHICSKNSLVSWKEPMKRELLSVNARTKNGLPITVTYTIDIWRSQGRMSGGEQVSFPIDAHPGTFFFMIESATVHPDLFLSVEGREKNRDKNCINLGYRRKFDENPSKTLLYTLKQLFIKLFLSPYKKEPDCQLTEDLHHLLKGTQLSLSCIIKDQRLKLEVWDNVEKLKWSGDPLMRSFPGHSKEENLQMAVEGLGRVLNFLITGKKAQSIPEPPKFIKATAISS